MVQSAEHSRHHVAIDGSQARRWPLFLVLREALTLRIANRYPRPGRILPVMCRNTVPILLTGTLPPCSPLRLGLTLSVLYADWFSFDSFNVVLSLSLPAPPCVMLTALCLRIWVNRQLASPPQTMTPSSISSSEDSPISEHPSMLKRLPMGMDDSPNARSKSVTVADGPDTYGVRLTLSEAR